MSDGDDKKLHVIELHAENFKRLRAVRIKPDGNFVQITGRNAQGKSSVLDALWALLGGKDASPKKPIREGADSAMLYVDLGDIRVRRHYTASGSTLVVETRDGAKYQSPQAVLDKLVGKLSFDPLEFSREDDKVKAQTLRALAGLDTTEIDQRRELLYDDRTAVNRNMKKFQSQLDGLPDVSAPDTEVSISELAKEHARANDEKRKNDGERTHLEKIVTDGKKARADVARLKDELKAAEAALVDANAAYKKQKAYVDILRDPNIDAITKRMEEAEEVNAAVAKKRERASKLAEFEERKTESTRLTKEIDACDAAKAAMLAAAKFPIVGLGVDGDMVTYNGVPLSQASSAEQIRICLAISGALNPKLRVALVRDGSLLDRDTMKIVAEWAEENNMQVLMERVADGNATGIVIEDGEVVGATK